MKAIWTQGLDDKEATRIRSEFEGSRYLFDRLIYILEKFDKESIKKTRSEKIFSLPSWKDKVANELGVQRALARIIEHIKE